MAWRMLARRAPGRSMTVVGDLAQASGPSSIRSWADALDAYAGDRWRSVELTVNYRTPAEIMSDRSRRAPVADPTANPPDAIRSVGEDPVAHRVSPAELPAVGGRASSAREVDAYDGAGSVGVIVPSAELASVAAAVAARRARGVDVGPGDAGQPGGRAHGRGGEGAGVRHGGRGRAGRHRGRARTWAARPLRGAHPSDPTARRRARRRTAARHGVAGDRPTAG